MGKTSSKVKDRYNAKVYDEMKIRVPKGRKAMIEAYTKENNGSVNGLINTLLRGIFNMSEEDWKKPVENTEE